MSLHSLKNIASSTKSSATAPSATASKVGFSPELAQHAEHMWKFLDELAEKDPEGYKKFLADQLKEAEAAKSESESSLFHPESGFVIYSKITSPSSLKPDLLFINICSSPQVPPVQDATGKQAAKPDAPLHEILIPLSVGKLRKEKDEATKSAVEFQASDIVFHPSTLQRCERDMSFKLFLIELALQNLEEDEKLKIHRGYKFATEIKYKGKAPPSQRTEQGIADLKEKLKQDKQAREKFAKEVKENAKKKEILLPTFSKIQEAEKQYEEKDKLTELKLTADQPKKKPLIEDVTDTVDLNALASTPAVSAPAASSNPSKPSSSTTSVKKPSTSTTLANHDHLADPDDKPFNVTTSTIGEQSELLLSQLASIPIQEKYNLPTSQAEHDAQTKQLLQEKQSTKQPSEPSSTKTSNTASSSSPAPAPSTTSSSSVKKTIPPFTWNIIDDKIQVSVTLLGLASIAEVEVDISSSQLVLNSPQYMLTLVFPQAIDDSQSTAKFIRKQGLLKITAPVKK